MTKTQLVYDSANDGSIDGDRLADGSVSNAKLEGSIDGAKLSDNSVSPGKLDFSSNSISSTHVDYLSQIPGAVSRPVSSRLGDFVSVLDFGAKGDDIQNDTAFIQKALDEVSAAGGGTVYVPPGVYKTNKPLIVKSNTVFEGSGPGTTIKCYGAGFPPGNAIHIGWGYEWDLNGSYFNPAYIGTDATLTQLLNDDYSNIKEKNIIVRNFHILHTNNGGSIWSLNATDFLVENLWCENAQTPINIANDAGGWQGACARCTVRNIYQIGAGAWYDLLFTGSAVDVTVSEMYTDPNSNSALAESMGCNGTVRLTIKNCILHKSDGSGKAGINILGGFGEDKQTIVEGNVIDGYNTGVILYNNFNSVVSNNQIRNSNIGLSIFGKNHLIDSNYFKGNTTDISGNIDATGNTITNNRGISTVNIPGFSNPSEFNHFSGNNLGVGTNVSSNTGYGGALRSRKFILSPIEAFVTTSQSSSVSIGLGSITTTAAPVSVFFKIPLQIKKITSLNLYGFSPVASETIDVDIVGFNSGINSASLPVLESLGSYTTSGAGDYGSSFTSSIFMFNSGGYYIRLTLDFSNSSTQVRSITISGLSDE